jgi:hypothetical protein
VIPDIRIDRKDLFGFIVRYGAEDSRAGSTFTDTFNWNASRVTCKSCN